MLRCRRKARGPCSTRARNAEIFSAAQTKRCEDASTNPRDVPGLLDTLFGTLYLAGAFCASPAFAADSAAAFAAFAAAAALAASSA
jgi:hypothetical protein